MREQSFRLSFESNPKNVTKVEDFVGQVATTYKIAPDVQGNMLISLTEAVTNAILHGNRCDCRKKVEIALKRQSGRLAVQVCDEGRGFDYNNLPDPTAPENIARCGGRGVFLMRQLSDSIEFRNNGSLIEMGFNLR